MTTLDDGTAGASLLRSPRLWSVALTITGTLLALLVIWKIIDLDPDVLTYMIKGGSPIHVVISVRVYSSSP